MIKYKTVSQLIKKIRRDSRKARLEKSAKQKHE